MAFGFFKKKDDAPAPAPTGAPGAPAPAEGPATEGGAPKPDPVKAARFFTHAQAMHDGSQFAYAMTLWLQGIRMDPTSTSAVENFARSASAWVNAEGGKAKGPTKDQAAQFAGRSALDKYLRLMLDWGAGSFDWRLGLKVFDAAVKLKLNEPAYWIGARVLGQAGQDSKAKKEPFVEMMRLFAEINGFDRAVVAGEIACRFDPGDGRLAAEVKNMSAQATMSKGGYETSGQQGGFRANVRDLSAQRAKEEEERIVKSEDVQTRAIANAAADYQTRPSDVSAVSKLARLLRERGTPEDEKQAYQVLMKGFEDTRNYRFKMDAGDIRLRAARRKLRDLRDEAAATPDDSAKREHFERAARQVLDMEVKEYSERVQNLPTDLSLRLELAKRCLEAGLNEQAIEHFQAARGSPGSLTPVLSGLGTAFLRLGWLDEAESSFREAVSSYTAQGDDTAAELRYGLMDVLQRKATESRSLAAAEEAFKLSAQIAMQRINFKDIRVRRQQLQDLVKSLKGGA